MRCAAFDVFDTSLTRRVAAPTEVFRIVGRELAGRTGQADAERFAEQFMEWRGEAERRAYARERKEETCLENIWLELRRLLPHLGAAGVLEPDLELEAEWSVLGPIASTRTRIGQERALGRKIIFISDMYLPGAFLRRCLQAHGLMQAGDSLYVSGEVGLTKRTGNLFRHVLSSEKIAPGDLSYFGDNPHCDREVPGRLGIPAELLRAPPLGRAEDLLLAQRPPRPPLWLETAGRLRFARMAGPPPAPGGPSDLIDEFLGPFLCLFGHWILQRARADGIGRLYFAARDARLLWAVARRLAEGTAPPVDCRYLHISRQAILLPSAHEVSAEGMPWLAREVGVKSLPRLLGKLELNFEDWAPRWRRIHADWRREDVLATAGHWREFWSLLQSPPFSEAVRQKIELRRTAALAYFARIGLLDSAPAALADVGWLLGCQEALNKICAGHRGGTPVHGYYLGLRRERSAPAEAGPAEALFYQNAADLPTPRFLLWMGHTGPIERILGIADHPSVGAYGLEGSILFNPAVPAIAPAHFETIEAALLRYAEKYGEAWKPLAADTEGTTALLAALLNDFLARPSAGSVAALEEIKISTEQNYPNNRPLIQPFTWPEVLCSLLPVRIARRLPVNRSAGREWPEASAIATPKARRLLHRSAPLVQRLYRRRQET